MKQGSKRKVALITGITGQDGAYLAEFLLNKGYEVHGVKRRTSLFNTERIDHLFHDPHESPSNFELHHGDMTDSSSLIRILQLVKPDEIYNLAAQSHVAVSFETPVGDDDDSFLGDFIEDKNTVIPGEAAENSNLRETTTRVLSSLTPREERVLRMRFGIGVNSDHTLEEVGQQFTVTRERIRQIEAKALRKLKHPSRSKQLKSFLDKS